ncbi:MAG: hypothetical protein ACLP3C_22630 [Mycobacterium sp.]|uniref:hypothetical protein n=1 Tax=Mycobacterium sp. TaxID=1785 RepID=UPI003C38CE2A
MRIRRTYLTALATAPAAAAAIFAAVIASPPHVQLSSAPIHNAPLDGDLNIPGVPGNIDFDVPDVNVPDIIDVPHVDVPNINLPNINPGHVGRPGRGR